MTALWTSTAMVAAMGGEAIGTLPPDIIGLSIDSRTLRPGEAFFAIKGDTHDGHDYVTAALETGAGLAVVARAQRARFPADARLIVVEDVLAALVHLARAARERAAARIIAVTGSVGKTSTKEALRLVLADQGETHASAASFNNHWGVPLSLARLPQAARFAVFEIGMNHAGEITPLTRLVRPHIAVITTVEPVHLEFFASVAAIADAKAEIFVGLEQGGVAVLNADNPHFARLKRHAHAAGIKRIVGFGAADKADVRLLDVALQADGSTVHANILGQDLAYKIGTPGRHVVMNSLAVLAAAVLAGADLALAALSLSSMRAPAGRGARVMLDLKPGQALLIDESYNANPASMAAAIAVLAQSPTGKKGRRIAVLGDMLELGATSSDLHAGLADTLQHHRIDKVFCAGPMMHHLWQALPMAQRGRHAESAARLVDAVVQGVAPGDVVMIKGSAGSHMSMIVKALSERYPAAASSDPAE